MPSSPFETHTTSEAHPGSIAILTGKTSSPSLPPKDTGTAQAFTEAKFATPLLPNITVLTTSTTSSVSTHAAFEESTTPVFSQFALNVSFHSVTDGILSTTTAGTGTLPSKQTSSSAISSAPLTSVITEAEGKIQTVVTPSIIPDFRLPATTSAVSEIKTVSSESFLKKETERKPDIITEGKTSVLGTLGPERISRFSTKATLPLLDLSSHVPTMNRTTTLDRTILGVSQPSATVANVTKTSFSPLLTTLSTLKPIVRPISSETTKVTIPLVEEGIKTMLIPVPQVLTQSTTIIPTDQSLLFSTIKKGIVQATSITHPSHLYFFPYLSTVSKPAMFSPTEPKLSGTKSPTSIESKEFLQTRLTSEYSPTIQPNVTESVSVLYTHPVSLHGTRVEPLSTQISSKKTTSLELQTLSSVSHKTPTAYKPPLSLKTTKIILEEDSLVATAKPEATKTSFTQEISDLVVHVPLVTKKIEPVQATGFLFTLHATAVTDRLAALFGTMESGKPTSMHARKPSTTLLPVSISAGALPQKVSDSMPSSAEAQVATSAILPPIPSKTTSLFSLLPITTQPPSTISSVSTPEPTIIEAFGSTRVPSSPYTNRSSQTPAVKELASTKRVPTLSAISLPLKTLAATEYLAKTSVSPYTLVQKIPERATTAEESTEIVRSTSKASFSLHTSPLEKVPSVLKEETTIPYFTGEKHGSSPASKAYLTTKATTTAYHVPVELEKTGIPLKSTLSTTESAAKLAISGTLFQSSLADIVSSSGLTSAFSAKPALTSGKDVTETPKSDTSLHQTRSVTPPEAAANLTMGGEPLSSTSEAPLPLPATDEEVAEFSHTEKLKTHLPTAKQVLTTSKTLTSPSGSFPQSESTTPSLYTLEAPQTPVASHKDTLEEAVLVPIVSTPATSTSRNITKISVLSKQVPLSTVSYTSTFPAARFTPATPHFRTTMESVPLRISGLTTQSATKSLAEKTAGIRESITTSLYTASSFASEAKDTTPGVPATDRQTLTAKFSISPSATKHSPPSLSSTILAAVSKRPSIMEIPTTSIDSLLIPPNTTVAVPPLTNLSVHDSASTEYSPGLTVVETGTTTSFFVPSKEIATFPSCVVSISPISFPLV